MQKKLSAASNKAAVLELHACGLSHRKIAMVLKISKTRVTQILAEQSKQSGQGGQPRRDAQLTRVVSRMPNIQMDIEKKLLKQQAIRQHRFWLTSAKLRESRFSLICSSFGTGPW